MWSLTFALCVPKFMRIHDLGLPDKLRLIMNPQLIIMFLAAVRS